MSYAGKDPRSRRTAASTAVAASASTRPRDAGRRVLERELSITARGIASPRHRQRPSEDHELDWQHIALFTTGALLGAFVGAGTALLLAPQSGARTRHNLARQGHQLRERTADAWDDLRHELRFAARRGRRKISRKVNRTLRDRRERRAFREDAPLDD